jgi:hypothetical protein
MNNTARTRPTSPARLAQLTGILFAVSTAVGFSLMGRNPEPDASISTVTRYWQAHHEHVSAAAIVLAYGGLFFAVFGTTLWSRIRGSGLHPLIGASALVATAVASVGLLANAMVYFALGDLATKPNTLPATLQTLHVLGSELSYSIAGGVELLLVTVAVAGIQGRAVPRWLAWSALPIALLQLTPIGFTAFLLCLPWSCAASVALVAQPAAVPGESRATPPAPSLAESH